MNALNNVHKRNAEREALKGGNNYTAQSKLFPDEHSEQRLDKATTLTSNNNVVLNDNGRKLMINHCLTMMVIITNSPKI